MASHYVRNDIIWIRYRDLDLPGAPWKAKSSGYKNGNVEIKHVKRTCRRLTAEEQIYSSRQPNGTHSDKTRWENWVEEWMDTHYSYCKGRPRHSDTLEVRRRSWLQLKIFLDENGITHPAMLTREHAFKYVPWREARNACRNTALSEVQFLAQLIDEAVLREYASFSQGNPWRKLGLKQGDTAEKNPWPDEAIQMVKDYHRDKERIYRWQHVTFEMALNQACRFHQCEVPLNCIDFDREIICYPKEIMKKQKEDFIQPMYGPFIPMLKKMVAYQERHGQKTLCEIPYAPYGSLYWSTLLKKLGFRTGDEETDLCYHGLRTTWATIAAKSNVVPESMAMKFMNHHSIEVHRIYQRFAPKDLRAVLDNLADSLGR